jgi:hypothetical protein
MELPHKEVTRHDVLGTFNTKDLTVGKCGTAEFVIRLAPGDVGKHIDFVLHNAGSHICDATALNSGRRSPGQADRG